MLIEQLAGGHWGMTSCRSLQYIQFSAGKLSDAIGDTEYWQCWVMLDTEVNEQKVDEQS